MKKLCLLCCMLIVIRNDIRSQSVIERLKLAVTELEKDSQLRHGILSFYVADSKTGKPVFEKNSQIGVAPASTQKIITSATSFELLGNNYQFKTYLNYDSEIKEGKLTGNLYLEGNGDPTLGSWRWKFTKEDSVLDRIVEILNQKGIKQIDGDIFIDDFSYSLQPVPDGWIWQDIGNYYGAGCWSVNWRENQYDLVLKSGKNVGEPTSIVKTIPSVANFSLFNFITAAKKNSGDNGYVYAPPFAQFGFTTGTIPVDEKTFVISGSMPRPALQFSKALDQKLKEKNIAVSGQIKLSSDIVVAGQPLRIGTHKLDSISSPELDTVNYWFMRKSINLYGEALVKAIAFREQGKNVTTEKGVDIVRNFWNERGIEKSAINIIDGSGLSPQNRVTTHALVKVLQFAKTRPWYRSFYQSVPEFNGMKIKSGTIGGAKSFAGYHTSSGGKEYIFAIIVNNYSGSSGELVKKMYKVLDVLK
ncbi:MAG TPA: D-alanyl-D-alanine carboxypeptidase/D-alanyl-D-alanine-endopeptidase [Flavitalea sp.]|nr:D-alanyl-D-alanine carboxypeptidase/D-alanyl-D-alanine-endopeptidase [Flavitalea sp.]